MLFNLILFTSYEIHFRVFCFLSVDFFLWIATRFFVLRFFCSSYLKNKNNKKRKRLHMRKNIIMFKFYIHVRRSHDYPTYLFSLLLFFFIKYMNKYFKHFMAKIKQIIYFLAQFPYRKRTLLSALCPSVWCSSISSSVWNFFDAVFSLKCVDYALLVPGKISKRVTFFCMC